MRGGADGRNVGHLHVRIGGGLKIDDLRLRADGGTHSFDVRATDAAGNTDQTPAGRATNLLVGPAAQLTDTWGQSRGGGTREHHAIDIMAPLGTLVLAAASGVVEKIFESGAGGHTIYVRTHDGRTVHYYAHLDSYGVREGQAVQQGQPIGRVGNTGSAAGGPTHLHFEIKTLQPGERWWQGANVNPYPLLARIGRGG